ncbi:hypothetical protein RDWZM_005965 [Blomia tropicalis]|uniref:Uncharacterized protein n=1 Tax=Blomia tropicalis TaxID=40697 RepID=A0A9Q0M7T6_BLOTA|nr:hypothetical protein RDWZM_005965 [Blomia tropicalis]
MADRRRHRLNANIPRPNDDNDQQQMDQIRQSFTDDANRGRTRTSRPLPNMPRFLTGQHPSPPPPYDWSNVPPTNINDLSSLSFYEQENQHSIDSNTPLWPPRTPPSMNEFPNFPYDSPNQNENNSDEPLWPPRTPPSSGRQGNFGRSSPIPTNQQSWDENSSNELLWLQRTPPNSGRYSNFGTSSPIPIPNTQQAWDTHNSNNPFTTPSRDDRFPNLSPIYGAINRGNWVDLDSPNINSNNPDQQRWPGRNRYGIQIVHGINDSIDGMPDWDHLQEIDRLMGYNNEPEGGGRQMFRLPQPPAYPPPPEYVDNGRNPFENIVQFDPVCYHCNHKGPNPPPDNIIQNDFSNGEGGGGRRGRGRARVGYDSYSIPMNHSSSFEDSSSRPHSWPMGTPQYSSYNHSSELPPTSEFDHDLPMNSFSQLSIGKSKGFIVESRSMLNTNEPLIANSDIPTMSRGSGNGGGGRGGGGVGGGQSFTLTPQDSLPEMRPGMDDPFNPQCSPRSELRPFPLCQYGKQRLDLFESSKTRLFNETPSPRSEPNSTQTTKTYVNPKTTITVSTNSSRLQPPSKFQFKPVPIPFTTEPPTIPKVARNVEAKKQIKFTPAPRVADGNKLPVPNPNAKPQTTQTNMPTTDDKSQKKKTDNSTGTGKSASVKKQNKKQHGTAATATTTTTAATTMTTATK